ncbi:MAG: 30S ribosomal protein S2 [Mycoplasmataceae bacterium]|nr:30S ribosomal protein S2 [Mycoplasmataceae bacterium]
MVNTTQKHRTLSPEINNWIEQRTSSFIKNNEHVGNIVPTLKLIEANAFMFLTGKRYDPKAKNFIISIPETKTKIFNPGLMLGKLSYAYHIIQDIVAKQGHILFVGTNVDTIKDLIQERAVATNSFYVNKRWLGGTLTNFKTVSKSIKKLNDFTRLQTSEAWSKYNKKEQLEISKKIEKLNKFIGGIKNVGSAGSRISVRNSIDALVVTDYKREHNAIAEAKQLNIPIISLCNSNTSAADARIAIPCNTNSTQTVWLLTNVLFDAVASAQGKDTVIINKSAAEIVLPKQVIKTDVKIINHKKNTRTF